jgi:gliding motility-associated-like protein
MKILLPFFLAFFPLFIYSQNSLNTIGAGARYVDIGDLDITGSQITVEAIIRKSNTTNSNIISKHTGVTDVNYLFRAASFGITTTTGFYSCTSPIILPINQWYHIAATYDGISIKYYVNGCKVTELPATGDLVQNDLITAIGARPGNTVPVEHFRGNIDEVRIWNVVRTETEIQQNMNFLLLTTQPGLLAYYKFNNNYLNSQGNAAFNGTPQGTPTFDVEAPLFIPLILISAIATDASCFGFSDGSVTITAAGTGALTYSIDGITYVSTSTFSNLPAGTYTAYVKSPQGCIVSQPFTIDQPPQVPTPIINFPSPLCETDSLFLSIDSLPNASCTWTGPNNFSTSILDTIIPNASAINSGNYSAFFTLNGCNSDTLIQPITVNPIYDINIDTAICSNESYSLGNQNLNTTGSYTLALQTIAGCDSIIHLTLQVNPAYSFVRDTSLCEGESFSFQGQTMNATGTYPFFLQTTLGCDSTITYNLIVYPIPAPPVLSSNSPVECPGDIINFQADSVNGGTFDWSGPNNFSSSSVANTFSFDIEDIGIYGSTVTVNGCESPISEIDLSILKIFTFDDFEFPNVITPNGDGINDNLDLENYFETCQEFTLYVLNRWGNLVYKQSNTGVPFEGLSLDTATLIDGVYFYKLSYEKGEKNGYIHVIR